MNTLACSYDKKNTTDRYTVLLSAILEPSTDVSTDEQIFAKINMGLNFVTSLGYEVDFTKLLYEIIYVTMSDNLSNLFLTTYSNLIDMDSQNTNSSKYTLLHRATGSRLYNTVKLLTNTYDCDIDLKNGEGRNVLEHAVYICAPIEIIEFLRSVIIKKKKDNKELAKENELLKNEVKQIKDQFSEQIAELFQQMQQLQIKTPNSIANIDEDRKHKIPRTIPSYYDHTTN
jgi:hypothetical protein